MTLNETEWRNSKYQPRRSITLEPHERPGWEIHHTVTRTAGNADELVAVTRDIYDDHVRKRGWADVFYGYLVARSGSFVVGRGLDRGTSSGMKWATIALVGEYEDANGDTVTKRQADTVAELIEWGRAQGVGPGIRGHRDRDQTACPGMRGMDLVAELRERFGSGAGTPPPPPAPEPGPAEMFELPELAWRFVAKGDRGRMVRVVQGIVTHGFGQGATIGPVDGIYGKRTAAGVANVQRFFDLAADGIVGPDTAGVLLTDWDAL